MMLQELSEEQIVQSVTEGEDAPFGRVRRTKDAIVGYFQKGLDVYEREAARLGIKPNITHQTYAAPGLASAALVLVPENSDQVITEIAVMLGLHVVGVGVARSTTWMYNRARNAGAVVAQRIARYASGNLEKTVDFVANPSNLTPTHAPKYGINKLKQFVEKIKTEGIQESIKIVEHDG